jgi:hypothetical protein
MRAAPGGEWRIRRKVFRTWGCEQKRGYFYFTDLEKPLDDVRHLVSVLHCCPDFENRLVVLEELSVALFAGGMLRFF